MRVFPTFRVSKMEGALMSYQSEQARAVSQVARLPGPATRRRTLAGEGVYHALLDSLLSLGKALVLSYS